MSRDIVHTSNASSPLAAIGKRQEDAGSVAAPIPRHDGAVASVISICGPIERTATAGACAGHLLDVTGALSAKLGHRA